MAEADGLFLKPKSLPFVIWSPIIIRVARPPWSLSKTIQRRSTANGFTNLIEAMSIGQPVIVTRTGALPGELDVEKAGCGLHIPPDNPGALASAIKTLAADPGRAEAMGRRGRHLVESHYSLAHYANRLHRFFETL